MQCILNPKNYSKKKVLNIVLINLILLYLHKYIEVYSLGRDFHILAKASSARVVLFLLNNNKMLKKHKIYKVLLLIAKNVLD